MILDRALGKHHASGDLLVRQPLGHQRRNLALGRGQDRQYGRLALLISVANDIPADRRQAVPQALVGEDDGASAGFGVSGLSERAAEMGGRVTAGRIGDSFLLTLMLPYRQLATPLRPEAS